jgi:opacity protein-like surface antigen
MIMRNALLGMISLLLLCATSLSQEYKRAEVFGGFQYAHVYPNANGAGWNAAVTGNLTHSIGFTGDFSGSYEHGSALYTYMVGPQVALRAQRVTPFVHALFGGAHADRLNAFAMALGGGLDVNASDYFALRVIQADWLSFRRAGESINQNVRVSIGAVLRF